MFSKKDRVYFYDILSNQLQYCNVYFRKKKSIKGRVKKRRIVAPNDIYKCLQGQLLEAMKEECNFPVHSASCAWMDGIDRKICASYHTGQKYVMEADISDFFGNITKEHLEQLFDHHSIKEVDGFTVQEIVQFVTFPDLEDKRRVLGQGFKTSPFLANAVRYSIDCRLQAIADERKLVYSAYGDNIYLSGDSVPREMIGIVQTVMNEHGFQINEAKTKIMPYYRRQVLLGITVNEKISVPRDYVNDIIADLVNRLKNGLPMDRSLSGKVATLRISNNLRNYEYAKRLVNLIGEQQHEQTNRTEILQSGGLPILQEQAVHAA